ncbi:MAG: primosomal protein N' [Cyanophyceae cyanobacterium]
MSFCPPLPPCPSPSDPDAGTIAIVEALVDSPGASGLYHYWVPSGEVVRPGDILLVPFGGQRLGAIAVRLSEDLERLPPSVAIDRLRPIEGVAMAAAFRPAYWQLLERVAAYYCAPLMQVLRAALPPGLLAKSQRRVTLRCPIDFIKAAADPDNPAATEPPLGAAAIALLTWWRRQKSVDYTWRYVCRHNPQGAIALKELQQRGYVESYWEAARPPRPKTRQAVTVLRSLLDADLADLPERQRQVLALAQRRGGDLWLTDLLDLAKTSSSTVKALVNKGYLALDDREVLRSQTGRDRADGGPKTLTAHQAIALAELQKLGPGEGALLHGITGSGKTELYLQVIAPILDRGQSALVLVPEIGLTPQLLDRFRGRFGDRVRAYHSHLSDGERYDTWRTMLGGGPQVVIGTRSAIFAPLPNLGAIVLDEEHDGSFKQDRPAPCYHARTVAQWRAELDGCPLILGSATPSMESWCAAAIPNSAAPTDPRLPKPLGAGDLTPLSQGFGEHEAEQSGQSHESEPGDGDGDEIFCDRGLPLRYLSLPDRATGQPLPPVQVIDMRDELAQGHRSVFSRTLQNHLATLRDRGEQAILFVQRRGYSTFVSCRSCGFVMNCPNCAVSLSYHRPRADGPPILRCHFCNHLAAHPDRCPSCASPYLKNFGNGTQRIVRALEVELPHLRPLRYDSDTTRTKHGHRLLLERFAAGEADVLVGTQMLAKGIDLPNVTLVGIVAADGLLYQSDYRAAERAVQTLIQVAGRAGRDRAGQVILQTYTPDHPAIAAVQRYQYLPFLATELEERRALAYPPVGRLILLRLSGPDEAAVIASADAIATALDPAQTDNLEEDLPYRLLGPSPAPVARIAQRHRWHLLIVVPPGGTPPTAEALEAARSRCKAQVSCAIDVDPLTFL